MNWGQRLKEEREKAAMTKTALAQAIGVSRGTVENGENGKKQMRVDHAERAFMALGAEIKIVSHRRARR